MHVDSTGNFNTIDGKCFAGEKLHVFWEWCSNHESFMAVTRVNSMSTTTTVTAYTAAGIQLHTYVIHRTFPPHNTSCL